MTVSNSKLSEKQQMFCREYIIDLNATQAAIRAGYSEKTANRIGYTQLTKADIQEYICSLKLERCDRVQIDSDWVLTQAKDAFLFNAQQVNDAQGNQRMVNATAAGKFLELCGKHTKVNAFNEEKESGNGDLSTAVNKLIDKLPN